MPLVLDGTNGVSGVDGTASNPAIEGTDSNTGIFYPAADTVAIGTGGTEALRVNSSQNVGIGTTSPTNPLQVNGNIVTTDGTTVNRMTRSGGVGLFGTTSNHPIAFQTNDTERMRLDTSGNFFIGTTSSDLAGAGVTTRISLNNAMGYAATNVNTGTGTYSVYQLGNSNNSNRAGVALFGSAWTTSGMYRQDGVYMYAAGAGGITINAESAQPIYFGTSNTERARITNNGTLCIGTTSELAARLAIISASGNTAINCGDAGDGSSYGIVQIVRPGDQPDNKFHLSFIRSGFRIAGMGFLDNSNTFAIQNNDNANNAGPGVTLPANATSWGTTSDERKKTINGFIQNAVEKLRDWRCVYFKYLADAEDAPQRIGLIAQDVQAVLPEAVTAEDDEINTLQLKYTETIPVLVKAIQELNAKVEAQAAEIAALKGAA